MKVPKLTFSVKDKSHSLYNTWWNMISRCYVDFAPGFENYGARGIKVSTDWLDFKKFLSDMGSSRPKGKTLDRVDNDGDYCVENCVWATRSDQMLNRRQFKNNTTGKTGVVKIGCRFEARFHSEGVRYRLGTFDSVELACDARKKFIVDFKKDAATAIKSIETETIWATNDTGTRGISKHKDGGFVVRVTVAGVRHYVGYFRTLDEAKNAKREFNKS